MYPLKAKQQNKNMPSQKQKQKHKQPIKAHKRRTKSQFFFHPETDIQKFYKKS
jgi:hypothetical protein